MRQLVTLTAMENFQGQKFSGNYKFDLNAYTILEMWPFQKFLSDAEMKKTTGALYVKVRNNANGNKTIIYCSNVHFENV